MSTTTGSTSTLSSTNWSKYTTGSTSTFFVYKLKWVQPRGQHQPCHLQTEVSTTTGSTSTFLSINWSGVQPQGQHQPCRLQTQVSRNTGSTSTLSSTNSDEYSYSAWFIFALFQRELQWILGLFSLCFRENCSEYLVYFRFVSERTAVSTWFM